jgi:hypothetical protein
MKVKKFNKTDHVWECMCCEEMEKRGYRSESKFWDDFFAHKEKPVKYELLKVDGRYKSGHQNR